MISNKRAAIDYDYLSADLVLEIITKVPIKKLFQLTCVSKLWRSLILSSHFHQIYSSRNPNPTTLLITVFKDYNSLENLRIYHSILKPPSHEEEPEKFVNSLNIKDAVRITQTVNGLFCVCYKNSNNHMCLALMSVQTGEIVTRLPHTKNHKLARYFLGFEPVNRVYKLLKIGKPSRFFFSRILDSNCFDFEILTLSYRSSDMCWKTLPKSSSPAIFGIQDGDLNVRKKFLDTQSFSVNGSLFWLYKDITTQLLISFDLREEKFRAIKPPHWLPDTWFTQFRGRLGLLNEEDDGLLPVIYTLDDKEGINWTRHAITLPSEVVQTLQSSPEENYCRAIPVGNLPTGELLLALVRTDYHFTPIYSYDYTNGSSSFKKFVVGKFPVVEGADMRDYRFEKKNTAAHIPYICFSVDDGMALLHLNV